jgi:hypothetical protein
LVVSLVEMVTTVLDQTAHLMAAVVVVEWVVLELLPISTEDMEL